MAQAGNLGIEAPERGVFAFDLLRKEELRDHEDREQKDHAKHQRRQGVDETWPIIHAAVAARTGERHQGNRLQMELHIVFSEKTAGRFCG